MFSDVRGAKTAMQGLLGSFDADSLTGEDAAVALKDFASIERLAVAGKLLCTRRVAETDAWRTSGHRRASDWLARQTGVTPGEAGRDLRTAEATRALPATETALRNGELSSAQAGEVTAGGTADPSAEQRLLATAKNKTVVELREESQRVRAAVRPDPDAHRERLRRERYLRKKLGDDGAALLMGKFLPDTLAEIWEVLELFLEDVFDDARRSGNHENNGAYTADALYEMALAALAYRLGHHVHEGTHGDDCQNDGHEDDDNESDDGWDDSWWSGHPDDGAGTGDPADLTADAPSGGDPTTEEPTSADTADSAITDTDRGESESESGTGSDDSNEGGSELFPDTPRPPTPPRPGPPPTAVDTSSPNTNGARQPSESGPAGRPNRPRASGLRAVVHIRVDKTAWDRGWTEAGEICEIPGHGPIPVCVARKYAARDPIIWALVVDGIDITRVSNASRHLTAAQRAALLERDPVCARPGCGATRHLEMHHLNPYAEGGPTALWNIGPLCKPDHLLTLQGHRLDREPDGTYTWYEPGQAPNRPPATPPPGMPATRNLTPREQAARTEADRIADPLADPLADRPDAA